jgi:hypothetical protein
MEKKTGIVRVVARNGGLKFDGEDVWYNPTDAAQGAVSPDLHGRMVELNLVGPMLFSGVHEVHSDALPDRELLISRQVAVKTAAEFAKAIPGTITSVPDLLRTADQIESWILKR